MAQDLKLLSYFASTKAPFMMEVATRTAPWHKRFCFVSSPPSCPMMPAGNLSATSTMLSVNYWHGLTVTPRRMLTRRAATLQRTTSSSGESRDYQ